MKTLFLLPFLMSFASGATLAIYEFDDNPLSAPTTSGEVSATVISYGEGLGTPRTSGVTFAPSGANALGFDPHVSDPAGTTPTTVDAAISRNFYFTFTLTPEPGTSMNLTLFSLWGNHGANAANDIELQIDTGSGFSSAGSITLTSTGSYHSIPLSGYDNLDSPVAFRVIIYDTDGVRWSSYSRLDDITITGTVIPEPSSAFLLLSTSTLLAFRKRCP